MKPTEEQQAILDSAGRVLLINARAGTGKTTTLKMVASAHPDRKILYLVYNRKAREEAEGSFPGNVTVRTVHSLAFSADAARWRAQVGPFTLADMLPPFRGWKNAHHLAALSFDFLGFFLNTPFPKVEAAMEAFQLAHLNHVADEVKKSFRDAQDQIVQASRNILSQWYRAERPCPHDFYLKLYHREGGFHDRLNSYDMILVDEGQDLSPIMLDALGQCRKWLVVVGDSHQQIYSFRYAVDAMKRFPCDDARDLTMSFRFGKSVAELASLFIREAKGEGRFRIEGNPEKSSRVGFYSGLPRSAPRERCAILSRTNVALFEKALDLKSIGVPFSLDGNISGVLGRILDIHWLSEKKYDNIHDAFIRSFESLDSLEAYARDLDDYPLTGLAKVAREYRRVFPDAVYDIMKISKASAGRGGPGLVLTTVHGAKGQEYDRVYIDRDLAAALSRPGGASRDESGDEANIAYVAFTRAIRELYLPPEFKEILTPEWRAGLKGYEPPPELTRTSHTPFQNTRAGGSPWRGPTVAPGGSTGAAGQPKAPRKTSFAIGDKVLTLHGTGTIVQVDGEKYLVHLDHQKAKLWEREWALKKSRG